MFGLKSFEKVRWRCLVWPNRADQVNNRKCAAGSAWWKTRQVNDDDDNDDDDDDDDDAEEEEDLGGFVDVVFYGIDYVDEDKVDYEDS